MGRVGGFRIPTVGVQVGADTDISMISCFKNQGVFALQFYGQSRCQVDRVKGKGRGFVCDRIVYFLLDYTNPMHSAGVVPIAMSRIEGNGFRG